MKQHYFITFEGIEGSGKSTQSKKLQQFFLKNNKEAFLTCEPGGTKIGNELRKILLDKNNNDINFLTEVFLHFASRSQHLSNFILPKISQQQTIICDRFYDSTFAYQGFAMGVDINIILQIKNLLLQYFGQKMEPNITFLLDLPVEIAFKRVVNRAENNRYENFDQNFHQKVRSGFLQLAQKNSSRIKIIDATQNEESIFNQILSYLH